MASLNCAMLSSDLQPVPLPGEKFLLSLQAIALSLYPCPVGAALNVAPPKDSTHLQANGSVFVSNKRVVFIGDGKKDDSQVKSLSVPHQFLVDGRFEQPIFSATRYTALCLPADGGGLSGPHIVKFSFKESGGYQFYETVEEMKNRLGASGSGRGTPVEALPLYSPSSGAGPSSLGTASVSSASSEPTEADFTAAAIARRAQEEEEDSAMAASTGDVRPPSAGPRRAEEARDGPPGYEP